MTNKRIAIACQGGGSQCAFVAGALKALFDDRIDERFQIVGLSGTSGGALTAALAWMGLLEKARRRDVDVGAGVMACWRDMTAQTPREIALDRICLDLSRLVEHGVLPSIASSPSSLQFRLSAQWASMFVGRPEFTDLRVLLEKHIDFAAIPDLVGPGSPALLVAAGDVLCGGFKIFSSVQRAITVDALLASAAIPNMFPAVWVGDRAYWDGIFASNPPLIAFLRQPLMGPGMLPEEISIIQVNRARHDIVPEAPAEISDRRNHLAGNLSMQHELQLLEVVNLLIAERALTGSFRERFGLDATEPITVRFIRMSEEIQRHLDYPSKLSRQPSHIARLVADGEAQARLFLDELASPDGARAGVAPVDEVAPAAPAGAS